MNKPPPYTSTQSGYTAPHQASRLSYHTPRPNGYGNGYEKFSPRPRYQDMWATVLFLLHLAGFIALAVFAIPKFVAAVQKGHEGFVIEGQGKSKVENEANIVKANSDLLVESAGPVALVMLSSLASGFLLSVLSILFMQRFANILIKVTLVLSVITYFAMAIFFTIKAMALMAVLTFFGALIYVLAAYTWRSRIPFATVMLEAILGVTKKYKGTLVVGVGGILLQTAIGVVLLFSDSIKITCKTLKGGREVCKHEIEPGAFAAYLYCLFCFFWTSQVIKNVVHVTVSGVFGVFYFLSNTPHMPTGSATLASLYRAMTTSFGSICFGSLIVAIIRFLRAVARTLADSDNNGGALALLACVAMCILGCIESLVEYFNQYAFAQVAIYGKPFCQAGKDTWTMIMDRGIEAIINDNLIGNVLSAICMLVGFVNVGVCFIVILLVVPSIIGHSTLFTGMLILCFMVGFGCMNVVAEVVESGSVTTFVALGEDPMALARTQPELFEKIRQAWPEVVMGVNS